REHPDVIGIDRLGLLLVEASRARAPIDTVERLNELVKREHITIGANRPTKQSQVVQETLADHSPLTVQEQVCARVALRKLLRAIPQHQRHVCKTRQERRHTSLNQRVVQRELTSS